MRETYSVDNSVKNGVQNGSMYSHAVKNLTLSNSDFSTELTYNYTQIPL